jgi:hypothetical protein
MHVGFTKGNKLACQARESDLPSRETVWDRVRVSSLVSVSLLNICFLAENMIQT